jgi:hypothetical protein
MQDQKTLEYLESNVNILENGQYEVGMLWAKDPIQLPNNRSLAEHRFCSLKGD